MVEHRLAPSTALDGRRLEVVGEAGGLVVRVGEGSAAWKRGEDTGTDACDVVEVAHEVFFVDIWLRSADEREAETVVFCGATGRGLRITCSVPDDAAPGQPRVAQHIAAVDVLVDGAPPSGAPVAPTRDLIGRRAISDYGHGHAFEQIYLNSTRMAWQCLLGEALGSADCDEASYWRLGDDLYVLTFRERAIPCASVVVLDFARQRSTGKFLNIEDDGAIRNGALGARLIPLATSTYPDGLLPL
jgi:hypothetical protein